MDTRTLGSAKNNTALDVSAIGLGCMSMSQAYGKPDMAESERTMKRALELGVTFFDTADAYGAGHNETLVGRMLGPVRNDIVLATKCGISRDPDTGARRICCTPEYVKSACDASLKRLGVEVIDLYYLHRLDPHVPIEDSVGAMSDLVQAGKIRHVGVSEMSSKTLRRAHATHPITAIQSEYSLWTRDPEDHVLPACSELGIGFVPFSPLGRAILTGIIRSEADLEEGDLRLGMPRFKGENLTKNLALVEQLQPIADARQCTTGQLSLAWILAKGDELVSIPGTKHVDRLEEDIAAAEIKLTAEEVAQIEAIMTRDAIAGPRYSEAMMRSIDKE
ncbi:MAG: aldo/keto reductase [Pseudomonadota bacterium]